MPMWQREQSPGADVVPQGEPVSSSAQVDRRGAAQRAVSPHRGAAGDDGVVGVLEEEVLGEELHKVRPAHGLRVLRVPHGSTTSTMY